MKDKRIALGVASENVFLDEGMNIDPELLDKQCKLIGSLLDENTPVDVILAKENQNLLAGVHEILAELWDQLPDDVKKEFD